MDIKITNPISKQRYSFRDRVHRRITRFAIWILQHTRIKKGLIGRLRSEYEHSRMSFVTVAAPDNIDLDLLTISVAELIPIENIPEFHRGVKKLLQKYRPRRLLVLNDPESVDEVFSDVQKSIMPGKWSRVGVLEFPEDSSIREFVWYSQIEFTHFSSSVAVAHFHIVPSEVYKEALKRLIKSEQYEEIVFQPTVKSFLRYWRSTTSSPEATKKQMLGDALLELKWRFFKEIGKFVPLFFYSTGTIGPSVEVYKLHEDSCRLRGTSRPFNAFWESLGMARQHSSYFDMTADGLYQVFSEQFATQKDPADKVIKVVGNVEQVVGVGMQNIDHQIRYQTEEFIRHLLPFVVIHSFCDLASVKLAEHRSLLYRTVRKRLMRYSSVVKLRLNLEREFHILSRLHGEFDSESLHVYRMLLSNSLLKLEPIGHDKRKTWPLMILDSSQRIVSDLVENFRLVSKMVDDRIGLLTIKSSYRIQFWTLILTAITAYLTYLSLRK